METRQPSLRIGRNVWDPINMPEAEFQQRVREIRRKMKQRGLDILLVYSNGFNDCGNTCYVSNYGIRLPRGVLVALPLNGEPVLFFEGSSRGLPFAKTTTWISDIRPCGDVAKECAKYLSENNLVSSSIGLVGLKHQMPHRQFRSLAEALKECTVDDADSMLQDLRMVKSQRECDQIRRSSRIVKHVFDFLANAAIPHMNETAVEAAIYREARLAGAEDVRILFSNPGEDQWALRLPEDATVAEGQTFIVYLAAAFERYWAEAIRTFVVQNGSFEEPELENAEALFKRIADEIKPGKAVSQFCGEAIKEIQEDGFGLISEYGFGGGIGLSLNEPPAITQVHANDLKEGMCLALRLALKDKSLGGIMTANTLVVKRSGAELLTASVGTLNKP
ncbi:MAG TPA: M24 family metallopeptidase [Desulfatiglandales bacterium]|nr:M24 family metallopeptidase [Desulfatiglandales bacterium]